MAARRQVDTSQYSDGNGDKLSLTHYPAQRGRILAAVSPPNLHDSHRKVNLQALPMSPDHGKDARNLQSPDLVPPMSQRLQ